MCKSKRFLPAIVIALISATPSFGHHSNAGIDRDSVEILRGVVTEFRWRNPHISFLLERQTIGGEIEQWEIETGGIPVLARSGWTGNSLTPGEVVTVRAHPDIRLRRHYALLVSLEKEDGSVLTQCSVPRAGFPTVTHCEPEVSGGSNDLNGVWRSRGWLGEGFASIKPTAKGAASRDQYRPDRDTPVAQCIGYPLVNNLQTRFYLNKVETNEADNTIVIRNEFMDATRTVYMDGRDHPEDAERTLNGHSIGRWEGDTLVADTRLFAEHRSPYGGRGIPSGRQKHVEERYSLSDDGTTVLIDILIEDPEYLVEPLTGSVEWSYSPELEFHRFDCDTDVADDYRSE